jgi:hypothetical protein
MKHRASTALFFGGPWVLLVAMACGTKTDYPPIQGGPYEAGGGGATSGGGGGGGVVSPCQKDYGGVCLGAGDMTQCPDPLPSGELCGSSSDVDGGSSGLFCCRGLNDAGAPDVIVEAGGQ